MSCYTYKEFYYDNGLFDNSIDITYIITMEDSVERHQHILNELKKHKPTKKVVIVYNKGFKKCLKRDKCGKINISYADLMHAVMHIFDISKNKDNILILEDDFIFNTNTRENDINSINNFLIKNNPIIYSLGSVHWLCSLFNFIHKRLYIKGASHAMIYSKKGRYLLKQQFESCKDVNKDIDLLTCFQKNTYGYYKNIYAQTFEETENRKNWSKNIKYFDLKIFVKCLIYIHKIFGLENKHNIHNKIDNLNCFLFSLHFLIVLILVYLLKILLFIK